MSDTRRPEQAILEGWWNEDPEMRYAEIMCGENLRVRVTLFEIQIKGHDSDDAVKVGQAEAGSLLEAIKKAVAEATR
jgi:hypothetical protein